MENFNFSWMEMCGPEGLVPWYPTKHDIGICFQQIFLEIPVLFLFATASAYYLGNRSLRRTNNRIVLTIRIRFFISLLIAILPLIHEILNLKFAHSSLRPVHILITAVKVITWFVHAGYVHTLRHESNVNGPVLCRVLWTLTTVLAAINVRSQALINQNSSSDLVSSYNFKFSIALLVMQIFYGLTFIPSIRKPENNLTLFDNHTQFSEHSHLLGSSFYHGFREDLDPEYLGIAMEDATIVSKLIFDWVNPLIKKGIEKKIRRSDDLFDLPLNLSTSVLCTKLHLMISNEEKETRSRYGATEMTPPAHSRQQSRTLFKALHKIFSVQFYSIGILKFLADVLGFAGPILLNKLVSFIEDKNEPVMWGYLYAGGLCLSTLVKAFLIVHFNFLMARLSLKMRGALISNVYRKVLVSSWSTVNKFSIGEIINFISTDTDRIVNSCASFHSFWSIPFQIAVTFYLLNEQIGISFLAGVAFTIVLIPINKLIASKIAELSTKVMHHKDERVAAMAEVLRGIRVLKLHVWEEHFLEKVLNIRKNELKYLKGRKYLDALCVYFWATTPIVISVLTFATYYLLGNQLKAASVFTTLALLNMLIAPLNAFPWILNGLTEAWVSVKRIQRFFDEKDSNLKDYFDAEPIEKRIAYRLIDCTFNWTADDETEREMVRNDPKTKSILGFNVKSIKHKIDLNEEEEEDEPESSRRIVPVEPGNGFCLKNVNIQVKAGSLIAIVGPIGSGKTSFLSALLGEMNKVKGSISMWNVEGGCALVTQTPWLQRGTLRDNVLFGKNFDGSWYKTVMNACCLTQDLESFRNGDSALVGDDGMTLSAGQRARVALARATYQNKDIYLIDDALSSVDVHVARQLYSEVICGLLKDKTRIFCTNHLQLVTNADMVIRLEDGSISAVGKPVDMLPDFDELANFEQESPSEKRESHREIREKKLIVEDEEESRETSSISFKVQRKYASSMGTFVVIMIILSLVLMQSSRNVTDYWLSEWVTAESNANVTRQLTGYLTSKSYMTGYVLLAVINTIFTLMRAFAFAYGGIRAATKIHELLVRKVVSSKITFFDITPLGRILNRFSSDSYTVDESLPFILNILLAQFFGLMGALIITVNGNSWLCFTFAPLIPIYNYVQNNYRHTSRELKRLSTVTLSPLYSHINETLQGLIVVRAFRCLPRFIQKNEEYLENNQKTLFASEAANQWLNFRLQMIGVVIVTAVGLTSVLQHEFNVVDAAVVGLTVSYALSITSSLNAVVTAFTETEKEMVSMERIGQYIDEIQSEVETGNDPPYAWPSQGVIVFESVYLKYREHLIPSLNGVSFETRPAEKIGVVGRTGAGKSSLIVALLRLVEISDGKILIDAVDINTLSLQGLRTRIAVIPLDPFLYEGTIRENVDPLEEFRDSEIWSALDKCHIRSLVEGHGGLGARISAGGKSFSQGQRQLLCLVRAVLRNAKIVCLDEATASVDAETDRQIQQTIRSCFRQSTVLTIAHRISTIMDSDRVLVLRDGEIIEFDAPEVLALDKNSYFHRLLQEEIRQI